jgi:hypothetical protein
MLSEIGKVLPMPLAAQLPTFSTLFNYNSHIVACEREELRDMADDQLLELLTEQGIERWNAWREKNPYTPIDLSHTDLSACNLTGANLSNANLQGTNFFEAHLTSINLSGADLSKARLEGAELNYINLYKSNLTAANMIGATFYDVNLSYANLRGAELGEANFRETSVTGTDFAECEMVSTMLGNMDLSEAQGLSEVIHWGPSTIGIDTIYRSSGNIPEEFLRGAGVPEPFINNIKALVGAMSPIEFYSCFISYSHNDKAFARKLHDTLQSKGVRCWLDEHQLLPGDDIYHEVDRGIRLWDKMLLCCSESSLKSWWVDNEIGTAFEKEQQLMKDRGAKVQVLVPLNLDGYLFSDKWQSGYQAQVRRRLAADFTEASDGGKFDEQVERLIRALRADEGARERPPKQRL